MASQFMEQKGNKACMLAPKKVTLDFGAVASLRFAGLWRQIKKTHSLCASLRLQSVAGKLQLKLNVAVKHPGHSLGACGAKQWSCRQPDCQSTKSEMFKLISVRASLCATSKVWREREPYVGSDRQINLKAHHGKQPVKPMIRHCRATQVAKRPLAPTFCKTT